jgi:hypothetical protein
MIGKSHNTVKKSELNRKNIAQKLGNVSCISYYIELKKPVISGLVVA